MPIMTAQQAFNVSMNEHPSLYASRSLEEAQIKYYDHIFNVIGNGYRDTKDFIKRRWEKEHTRINEFLNETIDRLENMLTPQITPKSRKKAI